MSLHLRCDAAALQFDCVRSELGVAAHLQQPMLSAFRGWKGCDFDRTGGAGLQFSRAIARAHDKSTTHRRVPQGYWHGRSVVDNLYFRRLAPMAHDLVRERN